MEAWTTIRYLQAQGVGIRAICRQLGVSRTAVRRVLRSDGPSHYQRPARPNQQLLQYEAQIHAWYFGQHLIGSRILRELRELGYTGGATALYAYLKQVRAATPSGTVTVRFERQQHDDAQPRQQEAFRPRPRQPLWLDIALLRAELNRRRHLAEHIVYECPSCETQSLGERRCPDCNTLGRALGLGGRCRACNSVLLLSDLLPQAGLHLP